MYNSCDYSGLVESWSCWPSRLPVCPQQVALTSLSWAYHWLLSETGRADLCTYWVSFGLGFCNGTLVFLTGLLAWLNLSLLISWKKMAAAAAAAAAATQVLVEDTPPQHRPSHIALRDSPREVSPSSWFEVWNKVFYVWILWGTCLA